MVTRWENNPRESDEENRIYGTFMANSIEKTAADLSSGEIGNLSQLWARARQARVESFLVQKKASKPEDLGNSLDQDYYRLASAERAPSTLTTGIGELGRYGYIHPAIHARLKAIGQKEHQTRKLSDPTEAGPAYAEWIDGDYKLVQCPANNRTDDAGENESVFGEYMLMVASPENPPSEEVNSRSMVLWSFQVGDVKSASGNFEQSDSGNFEDTFLYKVKLHNVMVPDDETRFVDTKAYARTNASFANALKATDRSEILDHAFEGYWNLVVAAPDARGSAAKSDYVLRSILLAKGIDLPPARAGLAPDLEAMSRSRPAWVQHARSVFDIE